LGVTMVLLVKSSFLLGCSNLLLHLRDPLALLPMAILRTIPVNLLAVPTTVAIRLASRAELAIIGVQGNATDFAGLSKGPQGGLGIGNTIYEYVVNLACSHARKGEPKLCLRESIYFPATRHEAVGS